MGFSKSQMPKILSNHESKTSDLYFIKRVESIINPDFLVLFFSGSQPIIKKSSNDKIFVQSDEVYINAKLFQKAIFFIIIFTDTFCN